MFNQKSQQQSIQRPITGLAITSIGLVLGLLIIQASALASLNPPAEKLVEIGPLKLIQLTKEPLETGFAFHVEFLSGLGWYIALTIAIAFILSIVIFQTHRAKPENTQPTPL